MKSPNIGHTKTLQFHFSLLVTMSHEDIFQAVMSLVRGSDTPSDAASRYNVLNREILEIDIKQESVQEEQDTSLVEPDNQQ